MIGVICNKLQKESVIEYFELFKTPWEFYDKRHFYDVIITTISQSDVLRSRLVLHFITFNNGTGQINDESAIKKDPICFNHEGMRVPLFCGALPMQESADQFLLLTEDKKPLAIRCDNEKQIIISTGFNIFDEVTYLMSQGQPPQFAAIPTLEIHIALMRQWMIESGVTFIEIPPVPYGYAFIACLTHDIDFIGIRQHFCDHSMWGFLYRALLRTPLDAVRRRMSWRNVLTNFIAVLSLPLIFLKVIKDIWDRFDQLIELEEGIPSTFYFMPFKNRTGEKIVSKKPNRRATKYDVNDATDIIKKLKKHGKEIGVHGIDAWNNIDHGLEEKARIQEITNDVSVGIRIHWLCFDRLSFIMLDKAGFAYDSTFGYNDVIGFRSGSAQPFKPIGCNNLFELPLHIQDTALFNSKRLNLDEPNAAIRCSDIVRHCTLYGGALTILWHQRSFGPERIWVRPYNDLIVKLYNKRVLFTSAMGAVEWFRYRRSVTFGPVTHQNSSIKIRLHSSAAIKPSIPVIIRVYKKQGITPVYFESAWNGEESITLSN
jgi:hypothetical protein